MSMSVDAAMEVLRGLDLFQENWEELAERVTSKAEGTDREGYDTDEYNGCLVTWGSDEEGRFTGRVASYEPDDDSLLVLTADGVQAILSLNAVQFVD